MWEIDLHLQKKEKVIYEGTPSWIIYWFQIFIAIILIGVFYDVFSFFAWIGFFLLVWVILKKFSTKFIVTNKRIIDREGILSEHVHSVTFKHVTSVGISIGIIDKIFSIGTIIIDTSGTGTDIELTWEGVSDPIKVKRIIEKKID